MSMTSEPSAYHRKKQPELVRRNLIEQAIRLMAEEGLHAVTVQAVSDAGGVSKGGFMHHFSSKHALVEAAFAELLAALDADLAARMAADPEPYGAFTRAYIQSVFELEQEAPGNPWAVLSIATLSDARLRTVWTEWYTQKLAEHHQTDSDLRLTLLRLAADGVWLSDLVNMVIEERTALHEYLIRGTYPKVENV